jgi:hypothetical protein
LAAYFLSLPIWTRKSRFFSPIVHHFGPRLFNFTDVILSIWKMNPVISISASFLSLVLVGHAQLGSMQNTKSKENYTSLIHVLF